MFKDISKISLSALLIFLVCVYVGLGLFKLLGSNMHSMIYLGSASIDLSNLIGVIEIAAAICLVYAKTRVIAAIVLLVDAMQATLSHFFHGDLKMTLPLMAIALLTFLLVMMARSTFQSPKMGV